MSNFINNDTIALFFLGIVACGALHTGNPDVTNIALGAIGGYIGSKAMPATVKKESEK